MIKFRVSGVNSKLSSMGIDLLNGVHVMIFDNVLHQDMPFISSWNYDFITDVLNIEIPNEFSFIVSSVKSSLMKYGNAIEEVIYDAL